MTSDFNEILQNRILPRVLKPGRYLGNELNVIKKNPDNIDVRVVLAFPDTYEMGMSYLGFDILYHLLNSTPWLAAERVYAPWHDMEAELRKEGFPLFALESKDSLISFDIIGFTLQYELHATNIINMIELAGLPVFAHDREDGMPIVLGGGPCAFNPEPLADFFDAFLIGDAEESIVAIAKVVADAKKNKQGREDILMMLAKIPGVYVPKLFNTEYDESGIFQRLTPLKDDISEFVQAQIIDELKPEYYSYKPLVPLIEVSHDRFSMEIMRGCTQGCRFCNAGIIYRPVRERKVPDMVQHAKNTIANSGYDEISLLSLSTSDYSQLIPLLESLQTMVKNKMVNISFPSLRPEMFTPELAKFAKGIRKSGLTLAPEAGTPRLRSVINKTNTNEDLLRAVDLAYREGWQLIKLYFMIGQPTETQEDIDAISDLILEVHKIGRKYSSSKRINVSISPFVPKSHTPFQWEEQCSTDVMQRKIQRICDRTKAKNVNINWRDPKVAMLEGIIARGDRTVGKAIYTAWENGAKFDAWTDHFNFSIWQKAFEDCNINPQVYLGARSFEAPLPWDHIQKGVTKKFLMDERFKAAKGIETQDCKYTQCNACGLMNEKACQDLIAKVKKDDTKISQAAPSAAGYGRSKKKAKTTKGLESVGAMRTHYTKNGAARFLSHLDTVRIFERAFARAEIELQFSQGFNPRPKVSYGPALAIGQSSDAEYLDFQFVRAPSTDLRSLLSLQMPEGFEIVGMRPIYGKVTSLTALITRADYTITFLDQNISEALERNIEKIMNQDSLIVEREKQGRKVEFDVRPFISSMKVSDTAVIDVMTVLENGKTIRIDEIVRVLSNEILNDIPLTQITRTGVYYYDDAGVLRTPMDAGKKMAHAL